ncbi:MAG TPA: D-Ala-D-Ala carboxypeptidase family metallohydrolase [Burkholderiales bacterium]|nr:D-Ala-D-Ala carboxypeptidase family metallohydrolase [Burkholderiales bacterium]
MRLSPNFSLDELVYSETAEQNGIDNTPPPEIVENLKRLAAGLEAVRALLGAPLEISSGYRCAALNQAVGGSSTSQHMHGLAVDFACPDFGSPLEIARAIQRSGLEFDQCILEYGRWVHLSFSDAPRRRLLTIYDQEKGYLAGLWDESGKLLA